MSDETPPNKSTDGSRDVEPAKRGDDNAQPSDAVVLNAILRFFEQVGINPNEPDAQLIVQQIQTASAYRGPIPPPEMLERYERAVPGLGQLIVDSWQQQQQHRLSLETTTTSRAEQRMDRSQKYGFVTALVSIAIAGVVGIYGSWGAAAVIAAVGVGGPGAASLIVRWLPNPNRE